MNILRAQVAALLGVTFVCASFQLHLHVPYKLEMRIVTEREMPSLSNETVKVTYPVTMLSDNHKRGLVVVNLRDAKKKSEQMAERLSALNNRPKNRKEAVDLYKSNKTEYIPNEILLEVICTSSGEPIVYGPDCVPISTESSNSSPAQSVMSDMEAFPIIYSGMSLPATGFVTMLICKDITPIEAWKSKCQSWTEGTIIHGSDCENSTGKVSALSSPDMVFTTRNVTSTIVEGDSDSGIPKQIMVDGNFALNSLDGHFKAKYSFGRVEHLTKDEAAKLVGSC